MELGSVLFVPVTQNIHVITQLRADLLTQYRLVSEMQGEAEADPEVVPSIQGEVRLDDFIRLRPGGIGDCQRPSR